MLLVEDEAVFARAVEKRLAKAGLACQVAGTLADARRLLMGPEPDAILLDMRLPDGSGLDLLSEVRERRGSAVPVLVLTAYGEVEDAVLAMKLRATDYLKKPIDLEELLVSIDKLFAQSELQRALEHSRQRERQGLDGLRFLGEHPSIVELRGQAERLGSLCARTAGPPPSVLILGETGTGKDLMAKLLHHSGPRRDRPFVHVDCAALPKDLIEGELFGHEKGAFTSAVGARSGLIEAAEDGVVFLDEVAELPIELQAKLLAVLERRTVRRLGSTRERPVSAWIIAATNRDPEAMVASGALRADLYFRLNVLAIRMPPLGERGADIVLLARDFAELLGAPLRVAGTQPHPRGLRRAHGLFVARQCARAQAPHGAGGVALGRGGHRYEGTDAAPGARVPVTRRRAGGGGRRAPRPQPRRSRAPPHRAGARRDRLQRLRGGPPARRDAHGDALPDAQALPGQVAGRRR